MEKTANVNGDAGVNHTTQKTSMKIESAEILLPSKDIAEDIEFWTSDDLGFRMDQIYPADNPQVVTLSGHGLRLRLDKAITASTPCTIRLLCSGALPEHRTLTSPSGTLVTFVPSSETLLQPITKPSFSVGRLKDNSAWIIGRAGMHYRDLIPSRLGGAIIASHIRIPDPGPVPDKVHFHEVGFQLIYCYSGWVRLVYEDQGEPFILRQGDCVIQPPRIRHRVLESGADLQVVEVGVPAEHMTMIDWEMELPNGRVSREREWDGQRFVRSLAGEAVWGEWRVPAWEVRDTGVGVGTGGVASVVVARPRLGDGKDFVVTSHGSDILFTFVLTGSCTLAAEGKGAHALTEGDAFTVPAGLKNCLSDLSSDLTLLEVSLPAKFETTIHTDTTL